MLDILKVSILRISMFLLLIYIYIITWLSMLKIISIELSGFMLFFFPIIILFIVFIFIILILQYKNNNIDFNFIINIILLFVIKLTGFSLYLLMKCKLSTASILINNKFIGIYVVKHAWSLDELLNIANQYLTKYGLTLLDTQLLSLLEESDTPESMIIKIDNIFKNQPLLSWVKLLENFIYENPIVTGLIILGITSFVTLVSIGISGIIFNSTKPTNLSHYVTPELHTAAMDNKISLSDIEILRLTLNDLLVLQSGIKEIMSVIAATSSSQANLAVQYKFIVDTLLNETDLILKPNIHTLVDLELETFTDSYDMMKVTYEQSLYLLSSLEKFM